MRRPIFNIKGNILILVIVLGGVSLFAILGLVSYAITENRASVYKSNREQALQIAEAGIAYYRWHLAHNKDDYQDGTGAPGPYTHEYRDKNGNLIGYYTLNLDAPENGSTIVTLFSTGWLADQPESKRTVKVRLGFPAISDYAFLVDGDLNFSSTAVVHGKTHANGHITFDGTSDAPISSALDINGSGGPKSYWLFPVPKKDLGGIQVKLDDAKTKSQINGLAWPYLPNSGAHGYQLIFNGDGTVDVEKVLSEPTCYSGFCYDADDFGPAVTYSVPTSSYIFVDDAIWVKGIVKGRPTLATMGNDIVINGNLTYAAKDGTNVIGLMTDQNIVFPFNLPDPMEVDAALVAVNGTIFRPKYLTGGVGDIISAQNFYGSRVSNYSGSMKYPGCSGICSGFSNTNYTYDANLTYRPPAGFPIGSSYDLISWEEVRTISNSDFVPVSSIVITPASTTILANTSVQFTAAAYPADATIKNITWSVEGGDPSGKITANGLYTAPDMAATYKVIASSGGVVAIATVKVTSNGNKPPTVENPPLANLTNPATVSSTNANLSVLGHDDGGYDNLRYSWTALSWPAGGSAPTFSNNNSNAAKNTVATFTRAGNYQFQVTITDQNGLSVTSATLLVTVVQKLSHVYPKPSPFVMGWDETQTFTATSTDQFNQPMGSTAAYTWSIVSGGGSINASGLYTPTSGSPGSATIAATAAGVSGNDIISITAPAAAPTIASEASKSSTAKNVTSDPYNVTANQTVLAFVASDAKAGKAGFSLSPTAGLTWSLVTMENVSAGAVGIYLGIPSTNLNNITTKFTASGQGASQTYLDIVVLNGALATLGSNGVNYGSGGQPSLTINASAGKSLVFAVGYDYAYSGAATTFTQTKLDEWKAANGQEAWVQRTTNPTNGAGNVSFSRTSPAAGPWNMAGVEVKTAGVGSLPPTIATPAAASPSTVNGVTTTLSVLGDDDGGESNLTYSWSFTKPAGADDPTFSAPDNSNQAKTTVVTFTQAGAYQFQATIKDQNGNVIQSAWVPVTVNQTLTAIIVSPSTINLAAGGAPVQFSATSSDQFGLAMSASYSYAWTATNGSINAATGLYYPPASTGSSTVKATASGLHGISMVSITATGGGGPNCESGTCVAICGDGIIEPGEGCDDGNTASNDGCSNLCVLENLPGLFCSNSSSVLPDTVHLPVVYRDFKGYPEAGGHPDFERYACGTFSTGLVQSTLTNGKPVFRTGVSNVGCGTQLTGANYFSQWYVDTSTVNRTVNDTLTLNLIGSSPPTYEFDSSVTPLGNTTNTTQLGFFPLDFIPTPATYGITPAGGGLNHNFGFTTEVHYWFTYQGGEVLSFSGDDDVWVFINGKLALDLGGLHPRVAGSVTLNAAKATQLGLVVGGAYDIALFNAERHTNQSNFKLTIGGFVKAKTECSAVCGDGITAPMPYEECDHGVSNGTTGDSCSAACKIIGEVL